MPLPSPLAPMILAALFLALSASTASGVLPCDAFVYPATTFGGRPAPAASARRKGPLPPPVASSPSDASAAAPESSSSAPEDSLPDSSSPDEAGEKDDPISAATGTLSSYDAAQQSFIASDGSQGMGGGTSALSYLRTLSPSDRSAMRDAVRTLAEEAGTERELDSSRGRVMLGFCASNAPEALGGLRTWVDGLGLPRGMLHGMDVDGDPIPPEELGSVYVKYSTGGAMTFAEMRKSGLGFDALWRPGDALLEPYDGDFRGVYLNVELGDGEFRQFGVLPTDLFAEEEGW